MHLRKAHALDKRETLLKVALRLGRKAANEVGRDRRVRERLADERDLRSVLRGCIVAVHAFEHRVAAALERQVELRTKPIEPFERAEQLFVDDADLERTQSDADVDVFERGDEFGKRRTDVLAVRRQVDARQHDLAAARGDRLALGDAIGKGARAAAAAQVRNEAIRTEVVAAVLNLDVRPRAVLGGVAKPVVFERKRRYVGRLFAKAHRCRRLVGDAAYIGHAALAAERACVVLTRAADHRDRRRRILAQTARDELARLAFRLARHRAGVDDVSVRRFERRDDLMSHAAQRGDDAVALILVDFATEVADRDLHLPNSPLS